ncbi:MAG: type IV pilin protein [Dechloromonas sp.]|nr:type IV pilin protein [Dechloromonas sp.]
MGNTSASRHGFTLIELLIVIAIIGILAAIAMPSYTNYIRKQELRAAESSLASMTLAMENRYMQSFSYAAATTTTADSQSTLTGWAPSQNKFDYIILTKDDSARTYTLQASGTGTMAGCTLSITESNVRSGPGCFGFSSWSE